MVVKLIKCDEYLTWYSDKIGQFFTVIDYTPHFYVNIDNYMPIKKEYCITINELRLDKLNNILK